MTADPRPYRASYLRAFAWLLIWGQLLAILPSVVHSWLGRYRLERRAAEVRQLLHDAGADRGPSNPDLKVGLRVASVPAATPSGRLVDLRQLATGRQGVLFVSSCAPCTAGLIDQYDRLFRSGLDVSVIARAPCQQIAAARRKYGWKIPCYSDANHPRAAQECRVRFRPAALVLDRNGRVVYVQGPTDDRQTAIKAVARILRKGSRPAPLARG